MRENSLSEESTYSVDESDLEELDFGCTLDTGYSLEELNI